MFINIVSILNRIMIVLLLILLKMISLLPMNHEEMFLMFLHQLYQSSHGLWQYNQNQKIIQLSIQ